MVWQEVIEGSNVWVYEYRANGYKANAMAILQGNNALVIVSPPLVLTQSSSGLPILVKSSLPRNPSPWEELLLRLGWLSAAQFLDGESKHSLIAAIALATEETAKEL